MRSFLKIIFKEKYSSLLFLLSDLLKYVLTDFLAFSQNNKHKV